MAKLEKPTKELDFCAKKMTIGHKESPSRTSPECRQESLEKSAESVGLGKTPVLLKRKSRIGGLSPDLKVDVDLENKLGIKLTGSELDGSLRDDLNSPSPRYDLSKLHNDHLTYSDVFVLKKRLTQQIKTIRGLQDESYQDSSPRLRVKKHKSSGSRKSLKVGHRNESPEALQWSFALAGPEVERFPESDWRSLKPTLDNNQERI